MTPRQPQRPPAADLLHVTGDRAEVEALLAERFRLRELWRGRIHRAYLDTFDWRLHRAGVVLAFERRDGRGELVCSSLSGRVRWRRPVAQSPAFAEDLPSGVATTKVAWTIRPRRLLTVAEARLTGCELGLCNADGTIVVRGLFEAREDGGDGLRLRITGVRGHPEARAELRAALEQAADPLVPVADEMAEVLASSGRQPRSYSSKVRPELAPEMSAEEALRSILRRLVEIMVRNEAGTRDDLDPEFLHDFRVAVRRTRTALGQVRGVLPAAGVAALRGDLKWLGEMTGPVRDLDVLLLELEGYQASLGGEERDALEPLHRHLEGQRRRAVRRLTRVLGSRRYRELKERWQSLASCGPELGEPPPDAGKPVLEVASRLIWKAYRRVLKRGRELAKAGEAVEVPSLHRLRIDAKKLRYLLELFSELFPDKPVKKLVGRLKRLQDFLGHLQDVYVHRRLFADAARQMHEVGEGNTETFLVVGRLLAEMEEAESREAGEFPDRFASFDRKKVQRTARKLFSEALR